MKYAVLLALLVACSKSKSDDRVASCNAPSAQSCREYRGDNLALGSESLAKLCTVVVSTAVFAMTPCPTAGVIGSCAKPEGKDFFYTGYADPDAEKHCTDGGGKFAK